MIDTGEGTLNSEEVATSHARARKARLTNAHRESATANNGRCMQKLRLSAGKAQMPSKEGTMSKEKVRLLTGKARRTPYARRGAL